MPPKRTVPRRGPTPSPAPSQSPAPRPSPARITGMAGGVVESGKAAQARTAIPAKYSISYGSPMAQLPNRAVTYGGADLAQATSALFATVQKDKQAAVEARRKADEQRKAASGKADSGKSTVSTTQASASNKDLEEESDEESGEVEEEESRDSDDEYVEEEDEETSPRRPGRPSKKPEPPKPTPTKASGNKRPHDDPEADQLAEKERAERGDRLKRDRSEEARRRAEEKLARAKAIAAKEAAAQEAVAEETRRRANEAAEKAMEQNRRQQEEAARQRAQREEERRRAREEAARQKAEQDRQAAEAEAEKAGQARLLEEKRHQSQPPPSVPPVVYSGRGSSLPPISTPVASRVPSIPESVRSFVEESNVYVDARLRTPKPPLPAPINAHRPSIQRPPILPKPPTRPDPPSSSDSEEETTQRPVDRIPSRIPIGSRTSGFSTDSRPPAPVDHIPNIHQRRPVPPVEPVEEHIETETRQPPLAKPASFVDRLKSSLSPWSLLKTFAMAWLLLYSYRLLYSWARPDLFESPVMSLHWYGWENWKSNVGQFVPSPLLHPLGVLSDDQYGKLKDFMEEQSSRTASAVDDIQKILPRMVHVQKDRRNGKLIVNDEFWRALRDQMINDDSILTLVDGKSDISDKHWKILQDRLKNSGDLEGIAGKTVSKSWEKWLKNNERKVAEIVANKLPRSTAENLVHEIQDIVVTKEQFTKQLEPFLEDNKMTNNKIKELEKFVNKALEKSESSGKAGISEARVQEIVHKAISKAKLESAARGELSRFDAELQRQVNHLAIGNGALVNEDLSSPTWLITDAPLGSKEWRNTLSSAPRFIAERSAALSTWEEAGHCWCAGTQINATHSRPADLFVHLASFIIPQYVAVEHIHPSATLDPNAMPKDIEVWAQFDEYHRREKMENFMEVAFPDSRRQNPGLLAKGFVQIGRFRYEYNGADRGVKVERLSQELVALGAATDHVLVRAVSNHGAADHTCFYRVRMYGEVVELDAGERESRRW